MKNQNTIMQLLQLAALLTMAASVAAGMTIRNLRVVSKELYGYASALFQAVFLLM